MPDMAHLAFSPLNCRSAACSLRPFTRRCDHRPEPVRSSRKEGPVMRRLFVLVSALVALVALGPMSVLGQEATPEPGGTARAQTDIRYVIPFGPDGLNAELTVTDNFTGTCIGDSIAVSDRADAFECLGEGDQVYDPC